MHKEYLPETTSNIFIYTPISHILRLSRDSLANKQTTKSFIQLFFFPLWQICTYSSFDWAHRYILEEGSLQRNSGRHYNRHHNHSTFMYVCSIDGLPNTKEKNQTHDIHLGTHNSTVKKSTSSQHELCKLLPSPKTYKHRFTVMLLLPFFTCPAELTSVWMKFYSVQRNQFKLLIAPFVSCHWWFKFKHP